MDTRGADIVGQITEQLSQLLGRAISQVQSIDQDHASLTILKVSLLDADQNQYPLVLKRQDDDGAYRLYRQYLEPYRLNSPKEYGYVELDGQRFLVMDYIRHRPADWADSSGYLRAVRWLIRKDLMTWRNLDAIRNLDCFGATQYYGVDYWLPEFEKWTKDSPSNGQAKQVWTSVSANRNRISDIIDELNEAGVQTVVHGDLQLSNVLFAEDGSDGELFVIDWTEPHIGSVTKDLASLYDNAPASIKRELVEAYRRQIDFDHFDEVFAKARVLRDIGYLSWMVWMINTGQQEDIAQDELDRVATSLTLALGKTA